MIKGTYEDDDLTAQRHRSVKKEERLLQEVLGWVHILIYWQMYYWCICKHWCKYSKQN